MKNRAQRIVFCAGHLGRKSQNGASLLVALVFLVILTMLGLMTFRVATQEERMAGNMRDRSVAFQAAEAALRDAENDVKCLKFDGSVATPTRAIGCISGMTGADASCTGGLCCAVSGLSCTEPKKPVHQAMDMTKLPSVAYGTHSGAPSLPGVQAQPRYLIEPFVWDKKRYYRITARGYGLGSTTQVTLQEVYKE